MLSIVKDQSLKMSAYISGTALMLRSMCFFAGYRSDVRRGDDGVIEDASLGMTTHFERFVENPVQTV